MQKNFISIHIKHWWQPCLLSLISVMSNLIWGKADPNPIKLQRPEKRSRDDSEKFSPIPISKKKYIPKEYV